MLQSMLISIVISLTNINCINLENKEARLCTNKTTLRNLIIKGVPQFMQKVFELSVAKRKVKSFDSLTV